jgi:hypothetical protein
MYDQALQKEERADNCFTLFQAADFDFSRSIKTT